jgi:hypothetical protein
MPEKLEDELRTVTDRSQSKIDSNMSIGKGFTAVDGASEEMVLCDTHQPLKRSKNEFPRIGDVYTMIIARLVCIAIFLTGFAYSSAQGTPRFWGKLKRGPYDIGFRQATYTDKNRADATQHIDGRPIQITIWYPAVPSQGSERISFGEYLKLSQVSTTPRDKAPEVQSLRDTLSIALSSEEGIDASVLDEILATKMQAVQGAPPVKKSFPLVLWSARHGTIAAQSVMCEYLASYGYVVAFARYDGPEVPLPYQISSPEVKVNTLKEHVSDLDFALSTLKTFRNVDRKKKTTIISWSYAGESATLLQMQNPDVGLVIALSSNVLSGWVYQDPAELSKLDATRLTAIYILMTEKFRTNGSVFTAPPILDGIQAYVVMFPQLAHGNFNATEGMIPSVMSISKVPRWSKAGPVAQRGYETIAHYALQFLDAYVKRDAKNLNRIREEGLYGKRLPVDFVTIMKYRPDAKKARKKRPE